MKYAVFTEPVTEPVHLAEAKLHLRTVMGDTSEDSLLISPLVTAAREYCENVTGRALAAQTLKAYPESWGLWRLPRPPVVSITSVKYYDTDNTEYTLAATDYQLDTVDGQLLILEEPTISLRELNPIVVEYTAGYTMDCPKAVRQAMLLLIAHWYQNREALGEVGGEVEIGVKRLLSQFREWWA